MRPDEPTPAPVERREVGPGPGPAALTRALTVEQGLARLDRSWWSWAGPQGGLVAGLCVRAAETALGEGRSPRSLTAHFLEPAPEGQLALSVSVLREGGASSVVAVEAGGAVRATVVGGRSRGEARLAAVVAPDVPGPEECPDLVLPVERVPFSQHLRYRAATDVRPLGGGDRAELVAWVRLVEDAPLDAAALTFLVDAMPPALYGATATPVAVPTLELGVSLPEAPPARGVGAAADRHPDGGRRLVRRRQRGLGRRGAPARPGTADAPGAGGVGLTA